MFDPITGSEQLKETFINYITTRFNIENKEFSNKFRKELSKEAIVTKGPYLDIGGAFESGQTLQTLSETGGASPLFQGLEPVSESERELNLHRPLYLHQEKALNKARKGKNLVVTTGTGSGKTECFLLPILNSILEEQEQGTLDAGVRAIIIYPMNALASDQMKRMRKLLKHSSITFGLYNGNTKHSKKDALQYYKSTHKNEEGKSEKPLSNELISREVMQETPPNILITNYSMLEYMLLRPKDDGVFTGAKLKFIVLDEAHIYKGATGIETSLLMRRVRARISNELRVQYILTSATLGGKDADSDIISFATTLCGAKFSEEDIIRSVEKKVEMVEHLDFPSELYSKLQESPATRQKVLSEYQADFSPSATIEEKLYDFYLHNRMFGELRKHGKSPLTIDDLQRKLSETHKITSEQLVSMISVCAEAEKNGASLIKPRYHYFVRALEGLFIGIGQTKELFLQQKSSIEVDGEEKIIFEAAVCEDCGRLALVGVCDGGYLRQGKRYDKELQYFLIKEQASEIVLDDEEDGEIPEADADAPQENENSYVICSICGAIDTSAGAALQDLCEHDQKHYVHLRRSTNKDTKDSESSVRCPACGFGDFMQAYLGSEAATGVLGTALFELLPKEEFATDIPCYEETLEDSAQENEFDDLFPAVSAPVTPKREIMPQFLCFSDSRSEAAYFAPYMDRTYREFLRRRGMWHVAERLREEGQTAVSMEFFVGEVAKYFTKHKSFLDWNIHKSEDLNQLTSISREQAWAAVLNEMFNARRGTSLVSLGLLSFEFLKNEQLAVGFEKKYTLPNNEARALLELLVQDIVYAGAIAPSSTDTISPAEMEYIFFTPHQKKMVLLKEGAKFNRNNITGWLPRKRTNGNFYQNTRLSRLARDLSLDGEEIVKMLQAYWKNVLAPKEEEFVLSASEFQVRLDAQFYRCNKCGRLTPYSVKNHCSSIKCTGTLSPCNPLEEHQNNHYVKLYRSETMKPLYIKEHTAQLSKTQQTTYQEAFQHKQIHALSCSTTFEMGVDLGSLETVYLRDVPPSPANYVQRAGRAGRGKNSAAFVLTYAKLSSHDFNYFQNPKGMICGEIKVPMFTVENDKIIKRHIFAVALSQFFNDHEEIYAENNQTVLLNEGGYEVLKEYLTPVPNHLTELLKQSIPSSAHQKMGILDGSWIDLLCGDGEVKGALQLAVDDFRETVATIETELQKARKAQDDAEAAKWSRILAGYRASKEDGKNKKLLIDFLVRNNVLPKYGFPVDVVELSPPVGMDQKYKDIQLQRDLQMAIADYAPGSQVIADGKMYTSRYLRKLPGRSKETVWEQGYYCRECPQCKQPNFTKDPLTIEGKPCISCQTVISRNKWKRTIEPRMGFFAEQATKDVPMKRPDRDYKTDDYYIGDPQRNFFSHLAFMVNGMELHMETTTNDSLVVVGQASYYVCSTCGYTSEAKIKEDHKTSQGYPCSNKQPNSGPYQLSHDFKTDVVKLTFLSEKANRDSLMFSVLFAVLEGISRELGVERTDLKGCLFKTKTTVGMIYSLILYDGVPGGAGHVRRLATETGDVLQKVLAHAQRLLQNCECDTSCYQCLRNYYNQKIHDTLDRKGAILFLAPWLGDFTKLEFEEPQKISISEIIVSQKQLASTEGTSWEKLSKSYQFSTSLASWDDAQIPMESYVLPTLHFGNQELSPLFVWEDAKIAVFEDSEEFSSLDFASQGWICYDFAVDPQELATKLRGD
ncbi:MAG: DEAD/DEAH box helicase [Eubacteriales bacterium]